jgi:protein-tyrosine phosphatase
MIDIHSHLLYGLDDGPESIEETFEIIRHLSSFGFTELIPTPHKFHLLFNPTPAQVAVKIQEIKRSIIKRFSFEYFCNIPQIKDAGDHYEISLTSDDKKVILIEFPAMVRKESVESKISALNQIGFVPIIAHIERYGKSDQFWLELKNRYRIYLQGGLKAFAKPFYDNSRKQLIRMINSGLIENLATDIHSASQLPKVEKAIDFIMKEYRGEYKRFFVDSFEG